MFIGYVSDGAGKCVKPKDTDCAKDTNIYLCRSGNVFCTDKGWRKIDNIYNNYCVAPSDDEC